MTDPGDRSAVHGTRRVELDRRVEATLASVEARKMAPALTSIRDSPDRWYGQLLGYTYDAVASVPAPERVLSAATAIELLREYARLRGELLIQLDDAVAHSFTRPPRTALLAGDYLNATAYGRLKAVSHPDLGEILDRMATVSASLASGFGVFDDQPDARDVVADTAGAIGAGAAHIGATLAGVDDERRERLTRAGRGFSIAHRITSPGQSWGEHVLPPAPDERQLRRYATRERAAAERALDGLTSNADVRTLREFVIAE